MREMNGGCENRWIRTSGLLVAAVLYCSSNLLLRAGDPVIFSNEKSKLQPRRPTDVGNDFVKSWDRPTGMSPLDVVVPPGMPRLNPADAKAEKRRQHAQDERRNWLLLGQGELTEKDSQENSFGVRDNDYRLDGLDKETAGRDFTFYPLTKQKTAGQNRAGSQPRLPGQSQNSDANPASPPKASLDSDADGGPRKSSQLSRDRESQFGAHTASELDLRTLLDTSPTGPRSSDKSELTLRDIFNPQQRREEPIHFLNSSAPNTSLSGLSDPINFRGRDQTRLPLNPVASNPFDEPARRAASDSFAPGPNFGASGSQHSQPGLFDPNPSRPSGPSDFPSPALQPQPPAPRMQVPTFEMPRRPSLFGP